MQEQEAAAWPFDAGAEKGKERTDEDLKEREAPATGAVYGLEGSV